MENNAIMLPSGCALACVSLVFGIKGEFHQKLACIFLFWLLQQRIIVLFFANHIILESRFQDERKHNYDTSFLIVWYSVFFLFLQRLYQVLSTLERRNETHIFRKGPMLVGSHVLHPQRTSLHKCPLFVIKPSPFWWNGPLMLSRQRFLLSKTLNPTDTDTHTHPCSSISIHLLDCLMRTKQNLYDRLIPSTKTDNHFFFSNVNKGIWVHRLSRSWEKQGFGSVVSRLDEQMQTWLPLCESSLLTTVTKIQSEAFLPVYIQSRMLAAGTWNWTSNSAPICFYQASSRRFFLVSRLLLSIIWQMTKRKNTQICVLGCKWQT